MEEIAIEFFCYENDKPYEIQLEPECYIFRVDANTTFKFVAKCDAPFKWSVRMDDGVQLFPNSFGHYEITIFENDILLQNWFKYM